jgi:hypothetical protein
MAIVRCVCCMIDGVWSSMSMSMVKGGMEEKGCSDRAI